MAKKRNDTNYANWVSTKFIYGPLIISVPFWGLLWISPVFAIMAACFLLISAYFVYACYEFSPRGKNIQAKLWELVLGYLDWDGTGNALDIGCGNAPLTIALAQQYPDGRVTGIDTWGKAWDYSKAICERNAKAAGVAKQTDFQKASASALPFEDGLFDTAVSNFVFHEVNDAKDKREVVREALRVI